MKFKCGLVGDYCLVLLHHQVKKITKIRCFLNMWCFNNNGKRVVGNNFKYVCHVKKRWVIPIREKDFNLCFVTPTGLCVFLIFLRHDKLLCFILKLIFKNLPNWCNIYKHEDFDDEKMIWCCKQNYQTWLLTKLVWSYWELSFAKTKVESG